MTESAFDTINGYQLSEKGAELVRYALDYMDKGFELPLSWWQDHIVPTYDEKLERALAVDGPVVACHELDVFDSWKTVCSNTHLYALAALEALQHVMNRAQAVMHILPPTSPTMSYAELRERRVLTTHSLRFLSHCGYLRVIRFQHLEQRIVGLGLEPRSWYFNTNNRSLTDSYCLWRDRTVASLDRQTITMLVSHYLAKNAPQRFGGGA